MNPEQPLTPFQTIISFDGLIASYEPFLESSDETLAARARKVIALGEEFPELRNGFRNVEDLEKYKEQIDILLADAFSPILTKNEIKTAGLPYENIIFKSSERFDSIVGNAGREFAPGLRNMNEKDMFIMACSVILTFAFNRDVKFRRPLYYDIPDSKGIMRHYRITYNADFMDILPTEKAVMLTDADIDELLDGFDDIELWKKKFPPGSWITKGFVISNMFDVTLDHSISELKTGLLRPVSNQAFSMAWFQRIFQTIFGIPDIRVGFSAYDPDSQRLRRLSQGIPSYLLANDHSETCDNVLCQGALNALLQEQHYFAISDIETYSQHSPKESAYGRYKDQGFESAILAPVIGEKGILGVLELLSYRKRELNSMNANKLADVMPFITTATERTLNEQANLIEAVIQHECTSIHESVKWRFEEEARRFLDEKSKGNAVSFREISFPGVFPLYGQTDIKDSSLARNKATQTDLITQLQTLSGIFSRSSESLKLPIFEEYHYRLQAQLEEVSLNYNSGTEQSVMQLLQDDIHPVLREMVSIDPKAKDAVDAYFESLDEMTGMIYQARKDYDQTVARINRELAKALDEKQQEAYKIFPHYYERYKTDGVEHTMYIGASISQRKKFSDVYLQNLKLWQLETLCYLENHYYALKPELPVTLDVASLILVHSSPITIKFRMDEKHFDVEGSYNTRYEVLKKRIDKAIIRDQEERLSKPGTLCIVYSQKSDETEYKRYIRLLQAKGVLTDHIEKLELEPLQGVSGLKALRVGIWYTQDNGKSMLTYDQLVHEMR